MKRVHFYKVHCRLGLIDIPYGSDEWNYGVEEGPDAVLSTEYLSGLGADYIIDSYTFTKPEDIVRSEYEHTIAKEYGEFADLIDKTYGEGEVQIVIGGDHSVTFASVIALMRRMKAGDLGYIQFDSHGDIHTFQSSPRGNFHGIYVRGFVGNMASESVQKLVGQRLPFENVRYFGNLVLEDEEKDYMARNHISVFSRKTLVDNKSQVLGELEKFIGSKKHIHVTFDVDVFDRKVQPATGILVDDGYFPEDVWPVLQVIGQAQSKSLDLVEINPRKPGIEKTLAIGHKIMQYFGL